MDLFGILVIVIECDKLCNVEEYLDCKNCTYRKWLTDKLVKERIENTDGSEIIYNGILNNYWNVCNSCTTYIVLFTIFLISSLSISSVFIYFYRYIKSDTNINSGTETTIYYTYKWEIFNKLTLKIEHITSLMT